MDRDAKVDELFSVFLRFRRHIHRQVVHQAHSPISVGQAEVLFAISKGMNRLRDIAKAQNITPSAATQQLKLLEATGLVKSMESPEDRRENLLSVTSKGQKLLHQQRIAMKQHLREYINRLTDHEIDTFITIMKKMTNNEISEES